MAVGAQVILLPEPSNPHDTHAIAVWNAPAKDAQLGYIPKTLNMTLAKSVPWGKKLDKYFGGVVIAEFRPGSQLGPVSGRGYFSPRRGSRLHVVARGEDDDEEGASTGPTTLENTSAADTVVISCRSCGGPEELTPDAEGFGERRGAGRLDDPMREVRNAPADLWHGYRPGLEFRCEFCRAPTCANNICATLRPRFVAPKPQREKTRSPPRRLDSRRALLRSSPRLKTPTRICACAFKNSSRPSSEVALPAFAFAALKRTQSFWRSPGDLSKEATAPSSRHFCRGSVRLGRSGARG